MAATTDSTLGWGPVSAPGVPAPVDTISQGVIVEPGVRQLWISGQLGCGADGKVIGVGDPATQVAAALDNLASMLAAAGAGWSNVAVLHFYVTSLEATMAVREVRERYLVQPRPASTMVVVAALGSTDLPGFEVEVEAMAVLP